MWLLGMFEDVGFTSVRQAIGFAIAALLFFGSLHFVFGVSALITLTILLSFLIILITACGCALHLREIEKLGEAESLESIREKADLQAQMIHEIVGPSRERLSRIQAEISIRTTIDGGAMKNLSAAQRVVDALDKRLNIIVTLISSEDSDDLLRADELVDSHLDIPSSSLHATTDADKIPALEPTLWRDTVEMLLNQVESQLPRKTPAAA